MRTRLIWITILLSLPLAARAGDLPAGLPDRAEVTLQSPRGAESVELLWRLDAGPDTSGGYVGGGTLGYGDYSLIPTAAPASPGSTWRLEDDLGDSYGMFSWNSANAFVPFSGGPGNDPGFTGAIATPSPAPEPGAAGVIMLLALQAMRRQLR
ncbi:MAG TPA: hypothetical protein VIL86_17515 [Tepidisphaeraceae bacterium]